MPKHKRRFLNKIYFIRLFKMKKAENILQIWPFWISLSLNTLITNVNIFYFSVICFQLRNQEKSKNAIKNIDKFGEIARFYSQWRHKM